MCSDLFRANRVVLCGDPGVGKTCLLRACEGTAFDDSYNPTHVASRSTWMAPDGVVLSVWDTGGEPKLRSLMDVFLEDVHVVIIVLDVTSRDAMASLPGWLAAVSAHGSPCVFVALNKSDGEPAVPDGALRAIRARRGARYFDVSARTGAGVRELFVSAARACAGGARPGGGGCCRVG